MLQPTNRYAYLPLQTGNATSIPVRLDLHCKQMYFDLIPGMPEKIEWPSSSLGAERALLFKTADSLWMIDSYGTSPIWRWDIRAKQWTAQEVSFPIQACTMGTDNVVCFSTFDAGYGIAAYQLTPQAFRLMGSIYALYPCTSIYSAFSLGENRWLFNVRTHEGYYGHQRLWVWEENRNVLYPLSSTWETVSVAANEKGILAAIETKPDWENIDLEHESPPSEQQSVDKASKALSKSTRLVWMDAREYVAQELAQLKETDRVVGISPEVAIIERYENGGRHYLAICADGSYQRLLQIPHGTIVHSVLVHEEQFIFLLSPHQPGASISTTMMQIERNRSTTHFSTLRRTNNMFY